MYPQITTPNRLCAFRLHIVESMLKVSANCVIGQPQKWAVFSGVESSRCNATSFNPKQRVSSSSSAVSMIPKMSTSAIPNQYVKKTMPNNKIDVQILVNGCSGKMGKANIHAAVSAGLNVVPISFGSAEKSGKTIQVGANEILVHGPSERENTLAILLEKYPNLIVFDFTAPSAVNDNAALYCKVGVLFVMGTTSGDTDQLYKNVEDSKIYAVISQQMGK